MQVGNVTLLTPQFPFTPKVKTLAIMCVCVCVSGTRKVECINPYTRLRRKVVEGLEYPFDIVSYGRNLYYTDWRRYREHFSDTLDAKLDLYLI